MEAIAKAKTRKVRKTNKKSIPDYLVYEIIDGKPIYYKGYEDVVKNKKQIDDIMGYSVIQSFIVKCIVSYLLKIEYNSLKFDYHILTNELGLHLNLQNNLAADIAIFAKDQFNNYTLTDKYISIPPKIVIEIDTKADLNNFDVVMDYVKNKTNKLFDFGVEKVFWIFTKSQKIILLEPESDWIIRTWDKKIEILPNIELSIKELLDAEGINYEKNEK